MSIAGGWRDVFLADTTQPGQTTVYFAKEGRLIVNRQQRTVVARAEERDATHHVNPKARRIRGADYTAVVLQMDPTTVFRQISPAKTVTEMTIAELEASIAAGAKRHDPGNSQRFMIQQKFAIPVASLVLALIGLALGVSHRKDGRLASFVLGFGVIFVYYVVLWTARAAALSGRFPLVWPHGFPTSSSALPASRSLMWRARSADQPIRISIPAFWRRSAPEPPNAEVARRARVASLPAVSWSSFASRTIDFPRPACWTGTCRGSTSGRSSSGVVALLGIFYISTFMDLADKLFRGSATTAMLLRYSLFPDAAVRLLHHSDVGARGDARDHRR